MYTPATVKSAAALPELESEPAVPATIRCRDRTIGRLCPHPASAFSARRAEAPLMPIFDDDTTTLSGPESDDPSLPLSRLPEAARVLQPFFTPPAVGATSNCSRGAKSPTRRRGHGDNGQDLERNNGDGSLGIVIPSFSIFIELSSADTLPYFPTLLDGMDDGHPPRLRLRRSSYARLVW